MGNFTVTRWLLVLPLCLMMALTTTHAGAATRSAPEVEAVVKTWIGEVLVAGPGQVVIRSMDPVLYKGETVAYIAHLFGGGYCLAGANDLSRPVIFYAPEGQYDPTSPGLQYFLDEIRESLLSIRESLASNDPRLVPHLGKLDERVSRWNDLIAGRVPPPSHQIIDRDIPNYLILPLTTQWDQRSPYNDECPTPNGPPYDGILSKVGCVATAMSQIMNYWKWPTRGQNTIGVFWPLHPLGDFQSTPLANDPGINAGDWAGRLEWMGSSNPPELRWGGTWDGSMKDKAYTISDDPEFTAALNSFLGNPPLEFQYEEENFLDSYYQWDLMEDRHVDSDGLDAGDAAVAKLCRDTSVSVLMNWGRFVSLASTSRTPGALVGYFKYDIDATYFGRNIDLMVDELAWGRPVLMRGGNSTGGGHAWVAQGYDATNGDISFLMNLGWGPASIGWYYVGDEGLGYVLEQNHTVMIAPNYSVRFVGSTSPFGGDGSPDNPYFSLTEAMNDAPDDVTLFLRSGMDAKVSGTGAILDKPHVIKALGATISHD